MQRVELSAFPDSYVEVETYPDDEGDGRVHVLGFKFDLDYASGTMTRAELIAVRDAINKELEQ